MFTVSEKRILITKWVGISIKKSFCLQKHDGLRYCLFQKTGCLITVDGSDDISIQPGLPMSPLDPSSGAPVMGNDAATESEENKAQEADDFEREDFEVVDQQERERNTFDILTNDLL